MIIFADGLDIYDSVEGGNENAISDRPEWEVTNNGGSPSFQNGATGSGRMLFMYVGDGTPGRFIRCRCTLSASYQEICVGGLFSFTVDNLDLRPFDNFFVLEDTVSGETVSLSLDANSKLVLASSLSGQSFIDPAVTQQAEYHYYEIEVQSGNVSLYGDDTLIGSVVLGGTVNFDRVDLVANLGSPYDRNQRMWVDDFYISDFPGGRLGPINIVPMIPTADGLIGTDMAPIPASPPEKYSKVDDNAGGNPTDKDATHIVGQLDGAKQTFTCSAERGFTGDALAFMISASCKTGLATSDTIDLLVAVGAQESATSGLSIPAAAWKVRTSQIFESLPDASALNQANLEAAEFGLRLNKT